MKSPTSHSLISGGQSGFTIVEIVVAFIIIAILTAVMVPTLMNRSAEARIHACEQELQNLADAEERAVTDTGYLIRPYALKCGLTSFLNAGGGNTSPFYTMFNPIYGANYYQIFITQTILPLPHVGEDYLNPATEQSLFSKITLTAAHTMYPPFNWNGPYVNWSKDTSGNLWPADPWGHPYLFFTRQGLICPPLDLSSTDPINKIYYTTDNSYPFQTSFQFLLSDGALHNFTTQNLFDRPTFVSLGPDGMPGNGTTVITDPNYGFNQTARGDDLVRSFGGN